MNLPSIEKSCNNKLTIVTIGEDRYAFSYETCVGFDRDRQGWVVRQNEWGPTTSRHLAELDGGSKEARARRITADQFAAMLRIRLATGI